MNRVTKISAWLVIWLFIAAALAIFPGAAAARAERRGLSKTDNKNEPIDWMAPPRESWCSPILPETGRVLMPRTSTCPIR